MSGLVSMKDSMAEMYCMSPGVGLGRIGHWYITKSTVPKKVIWRYSSAEDDGRHVIP